MSRDDKFLKSISTSPKAILTRTNVTILKHWNTCIIITINIIKYKFNTIPSTSIANIEYNFRFNILALIAGETTRNQSPGRLVAPLYPKLGETLPSEHTPFHFLPPWAPTLCSPHVRKATTREFIQPSRFIPSKINHLEKSQPQPPRFSATTATATTGKQLRRYRRRFLRTRIEILSSRIPGSSVASNTPIRGISSRVTRGNILRSSPFDQSGTWKAVPKPWLLSFYVDSGQLRTRHDGHRLLKAESRKPGAIEW